MKNIFNKLRQKWTNTDINKKSRIITISVLTLLLVSSTIILATNGFFAKAATLTVDSNSSVISGTSGKAVSDTVENAASATYHLNGVGDVFCIEPGISATDGLDYGELSSSSLTTVKYRTTSGTHKSVSVTNSMKEYWSLISYYYENHWSEYDAGALRAAAQMLVWEVSTKGRTSFDHYQPDGYSGTGSYWYKRVDGKTTSLANAYRAIVDFVYYYYQDPTGTSDSEEENRYTLSYNDSISKYEKTIQSDSNISEYSCSSDNSAISISVSGSTILVQSSSFLSDYATITCTRGSSIGGQFFQYTSDYQRVVHGNFTPEKTIKFQVKTEGFPLGINKNNENGNALSGAVFTVSNGIDSYIINGNEGTVIIKQPGTYTIEETTVPEGYQKMPTQTVNITGSQTFTFSDKALQLEFKKVDAETNQTIINGIGFTIYKGDKNNRVKLLERDSSGCYIESNSGSYIETVPDSNGNVCIKRVTSGAKYIVEETTVPVGYQKTVDTNITAPTYDGASEKTVYGNVTNKPLKIKFYKEDSETGQRINNAGFKIYKGSTLVKFDSRDGNGCYKESSTGTVSEVFTDTSINNGEVCLSYVTSGTGYTIKETTIPEKYKKMPDATITAKKNTDAVNISEKGLKDTPLYMYFSKKDSIKNIPLNGVGFKVYKDGKQIKFTEKQSDGCYHESTGGTVSTVRSSDINITTVNESGISTTTAIQGGVCLKYITGNIDYKIIETEPLDGYTFFKPQDEESGIIINVNKSTGVQLNKNLDGTSRENSLLINYPTMLEFKKKTSDDGNSEDSSITKLTDIAKFTITNSGSTTPLTFIDKGNGEYWYDESGTVTLLHTTNRKFIVKYLPWGDYVVNEASYVLTNSEKKIVFNLTGTSYNDESIKGIPGYYYNSENSPFTITKYANGVINNMPSITSNIINDPVVISFEKTDIYKYYTSDDIAKLNSNEKLLDTAKFILKDSGGNILNLKLVETNEIQGNVYRYLPVDSNNTVNEINTYNGKLTITHLLNNTNYTIEEIESPEGFILPEEHPKVVYSIKEEKPESEKDSSITQVIENIPTKVKIEKRDLKTGYLIKDEQEKTTFELYKLDADGSKERIYVTDRVPIIDADGNIEYSYRYSKLNEKTDVEIKLTNGYIIFRYLPKGNYVLVETEAPEGYDLPVGISSETTFEVSGTTTESEIEVIKNKPSKIILKKYSEDGLLLSGARFKLYKVNKDDYDINLSIKNNALLHGEVLKLKTIRDGEYEYKNEKDTDVITTCTKDCSLIGKETGDAGTIETGMLQVEYLDTENYYIFEEIEAPSGYTLPEDPYTLVYLPESVDGENVNIEIENKYTPVTFYKFDEYNNLLDGAVYKLQKLNSSKVYEDVTVSKMEGKEGSVYSIDFNTENVDITTTNGTATIYLLTEGQYRILETKAPEGYELPKASINVATFFVTDTGDVKGEFIITNKKPTSPNVKLNKANSELVISIQTGQTIIKYSLIIIGLSFIIAGLIFINKKLK